VHWATQDPRQLWAWWLTDPAANIGIATGRPNQLAVVDLDVKSGDDGPGNFARFLAEYRLELPAGPYARTPSGGCHIWLRTPPGIAVPERKILPGVDIKGSGGLIVVPPSMQLVSPMIRPGERGSEPVPIPYTWHGCPCQVPPAPSWFGSWIMTAPSAGQPGGLGTGTAGDGIDAQAVIEHGAPAGERNATLYKLACSRYRKHGTGPAGCTAVIAELQQAWQASGTAGMPWREVLVCAESARRFIEKQEANERQVTDQFRAYLGARGGAR
jgi:hypothetical protein